MSKLDIVIIITKTDKLSVAINGLTYCRVTQALTYWEPATLRRFHADRVLGAVREGVGVRPLATNTCTPSSE